MEINLTAIVAVPERRVSLRILDVAISLRLA